MSMLTQFCVVAVAAAVFSAWRGPADVQAQATPAQPDREALLERHSKDEKAGTAAGGRKLFEERCAPCHRFGGLGRDVGPDLTTIASRFKRRDVLDAVLWPSKVISDQYAAEVFELADGTFVSGLIVRENAAAVLLRTSDPNAKPVVVQKAQVAGRTTSTVSLMPEGLVDDLDDTQIADLLAFVLAAPPEK